MKKTGKVVFGVVSAAALVATGYASWSINKGFTQVSSNPISGTVTEILDNSFGKITLKENDTTLVFDAPKKYYNGTEDLEVSYFVKAHANDGEHVNDYDPYDLTRYDLVSQDYRPYLNISAEVTDQNGDPLEDEEKLANIEKLIDLPTMVIDYHEWLGEEAKESVDGYLVNYQILWDQDTFGGVNPQIVYDNDSSLDVLTKREKFQEIIDTLSGVYFKLTFKVGYYGELPPEVPEEKYGVVTFEEVSNLSLKLTADDKEVKSGDKLKVGTVVKVEATPNDNYHLVSLTHNGNSILDTMSFEVVENENTIVASVEEDEIPPVTTNENTFDKLDSLNANDQVTIEGRIIAIGYNGALVYDGTQFGYVTQNTSTKNITGAYKVGDVIKVNGYVSVFYGFNMASVDDHGPSGAELTVEASTLTVDDPMTSLTPTEWGEEELSNYASSVDAGPYYVTVKGAKYTKSGNNNNFSVGDFTKGSILLDDDNNKLVAGKTYNLTGFMVYSASKGVATSYKNMVLTSFEEVEVSATKVAEVTLNPTTIKVGETTTVTAKDDLGNDLTDITIVPVDDTQDVVEVSGTTLKGLKADKFEFTVTSGKLAASNVMTLVVEEESTVVEETILNVNFKEDPKSNFTSPNGVALSSYGDRILKISEGNNLVFNAANWGGLGEGNQINIGTNKSDAADYLGTNLPASMLAAITETEVTEDAYQVGNNYYYGFYMDFNVDGVKKVEFKFKSYTDTFTNFYIVSSTDGVIWEKVDEYASGNITDFTISHTFDDAKDGTRYGIVMESSKMKSRRPLDSFNLYK